MSEPAEPKSFKEYLESTPPGKKEVVTDAASGSGATGFRPSTPELLLHCEECSGLRTFVNGDKYSSLPILRARTPNDVFLAYYCRNCQADIKTFALAITFNETTEAWSVWKYGESPAFGPPIPPKALALAGGDRELFLKGRRCENQGLGVGAFVYYRRVVEDQKARIFDEVIRVVRHVAPDSGLIADLESAKGEKQFTKAVESIKRGLPQSLMINGHNPLTLLHSALSEGVHSHSDEECLELASDIRIVLVEFAERLSSAMKEELALNEAVNRLAKSKRK